MEKRMAGIIPKTSGKRSDDGSGGVLHMRFLLT
jgi:hypothetical protein